MGWMIFGAIVVGFLSLAQWRGWIDLTGKHESSGGIGMLGIVDQLFAPHRHEIQTMREEQRQLPAPMVDAPDGDLGVSGATSEAKYRGTYRIDL